LINYQYLEIIKDLAYFNNNQTTHHPNTVFAEVSNPIDKVAAFLETIITQFMDGTKAVTKKNAHHQI